MKAYDYKSELIYEEYMCISHDAYHEKIRYYESKIADTLRIDFELCTEIRIDYVYALYKVGAYAQFIRKVESILKLVIRENIYTFRGKDVYKELLYRKAMCHYRMQEFKQAIDVFSAVLKMDRHNESYQKDFYKCLRDHYRGRNQSLRGLSIFVFLVLGIVIALDLLLIRSFYPQQIQILNILKAGLFTMGNGIILYNELSIRARSKAIIKSLIS